MLRQNQEDYLRAIFYQYEKGNSNINSVAIAKHLDISKAAVSKMLKRLVKQKLIKMEPYSCLTLTNQGLRESKKLTFKHRIVEVFLADILKVNKNVIHKEAHELEHAFSDNTINKLANFLDNPKICPDGKNIPQLINNF